MPLEATTVAVTEFDCAYAGAAPSSVVAVAAAATVRPAARRLKRRERVMVCDMGCSLS